MMIGLDVGGTHTDVVLLGKDGVLNRAKIRTHEDNLFSSMVSALEAMLEGVDAHRIDRVVLSSTLTTNAIVRREVAAVGMVVTAGPGIDPELYRTGPEYHVARGAIDHRGRETKPLDEAQLLDIIEVLKAQKVRQVGIVGKFSTRNPAHEEAIGALFAPHFERLFYGHQVSGHLDFPRRIATTYLNAAVYPVHRAFFEAIDQALREKGLTAPVHVMKADGGTMSLAASIAAPAQTILSGPAASIMGAMPSAAADEDAVVLDIGGTTTDIALLVRGVPLIEEPGTRIDRFKTLIRALQTNSIGIGGDSYVRVDKGVLRIGPERRGRALAYGGPAPTPTDAFIVLGELDHGDRQAAEAGVAEVGAALGLETRAAAERIIEHACKVIMAAVESLLSCANSWPVYTIHELLERYEIRPCKVMVLGGPAQLFARHLAAISEIEVVLTPEWGVANAIGAAMARTTSEVCLVADTEQGGVMLSDSDQQWECGPDYNRAEALEQARSHLRDKALAEGARVEDIEIDITENSQFNIVRDGVRTGRLIRVSAQVRPGLIGHLAPATLTTPISGRS